MINEIWKDIPNFEGIYQVSNIGNVKSLKFNKEKILKPYISNGYEKINLKINKSYKKFFVHRLVGCCFLGLDLSNTDTIINHIDGIRNNNNLENLEILSQIENVIDGVKRKYKLNTDCEIIDNIEYCNINIWKAYCVHNEIKILLGEFTSINDAIFAITIANTLLFKLENPAS